MGQPGDPEPVPRSVLSGFGLSDDWTIQHLRTLNNAVFAVSRADQPAWVLRRHRPGWRTVSSLQLEIDLLTFLADELPELIKVPRPAAGPTGDQLLTIDGDHYSLLEWLPGSPRRPDTGLENDGARLLGEALGTIHSALDRWGERPAPVVWTADTLFATHPGLMGAEPSELEQYLSAQELQFFHEIAGRTAMIFEGVDDWGLIHGDFILGNCHWHAEAGRTGLGVLDFDDFGSGPRLFDLGAILGNLADYPETRTAHIEAFLAGYRTAHSLAANAEPDLPVMMAARHLSQCLWVLGHRELGETWIRTHLRVRLELARECLAVTL